MKTIAKIFLLALLFAGGVFVPQVTEASGPRYCDIEGTCDPYQPDPNVSEPEPAPQPAPAAAAPANRTQSAPTANRASANTNGTQVKVTAYVAPTTQSSPAAPAVSETAVAPAVEAPVAPETVYVAPAAATPATGNDTNPALWGFLSALTAGTGFAFKVFRGLA